MNFIEHAFKKAEKRNWPAIYVAVDIHDTMGKGTYKKDNEGFTLYPWAKEVLMNLSENPRVKLIIYTASHVEQAEKVAAWLKDQHIRIYAINENPDIKNTELCDFSRKFYFDVLFEDKAGFQGWRDWFRVMKELQRIGEWIPMLKDDGVEITLFDSDDTIIQYSKGPSSYEYFKLHRELRCDWDCPICQFAMGKLQT